MDKPKSRDRQALLTPELKVKLLDHREELEFLLTAYEDEIPEELVTVSEHVYKCQKHWFSFLSGIFSELHSDIPDQLKTGEFNRLILEASSFIDGYINKEVNPIKGVKLTTRADIDKGDELLEAFTVEIDKILHQYPES